MKGIGPAVVGMLLSAGFTIARASLVDVWTGLLALVCLVALVRFKVDASLLVVAADAIGLVFM